MRQGIKRREFYVGCKRQIGIDEKAQDEEQPFVHAVCATVNYLFKCEPRSLIYTVFRLFLFICLGVFFVFLTSI